MKAVCKKLFSLMLVAILLVSAVPFQASAEEVAETVAPTVAATEPAVVGTTAPEVAPVAEVIETEPVQQEINVNTPAAQGDVVMKEDRYVEFQVDVDGTYYRISVAKTKIGSKVGTPNEAAVLNVIKSVRGNADGYKLIRWECNDATFTGSTVISLGMPVTTLDDPQDKYDDEIEPFTIQVNAITEIVAKDISLKPNGGTVAKNTVSVVVGQDYPELPTPTRAGYEFKGWMRADGRMVTEEDKKVMDLGALTAQWAITKPTVIYWNYNNEEVGYGSFQVENGSVLKTAYNNFPTEAQAKALFNADPETGWWMAGWEFSVDGGETFNTFKEGSTKITANTIIRPLYQKTITLHAQDPGITSRKLTISLGKKYPALPHPGTRDGLAFTSWHKDEACTEEERVSTKDNLSNVSTHAVAEFSDEALYARWDIASTIYLYIHTNGNTDDHTKLVRYYDVPMEGLNLKNIDLASIFPNYSKYDDDGDEKYGWYSPAQWKNYVLGRHVNDTTEVFTPAAQDPGDDVYEFYIMLIDNGNNTTTGAANGYKDNTVTRDPSNPSTGDDIFVAVTIMAVSACALLLFFMNKKRFAK